jgi:hypothetical protein
MIWYYEEGNRIGSYVKFRGPNPEYTVYTWTEPNFDAMHPAKAQQQVEEEAVAIVVESLAVQNTRLKDELKHAQIENAQLKQKLRTQQRAKLFLYTAIALLGIAFLYVFFCRKTRN